MGFWIFIILALLVSFSLAGKKADKIYYEVSDKIIILDTNRHKFSDEDNKKVVQVLENYRQQSNSSEFGSLMYATRKRAMRDLETSKYAVEQIYSTIVKKYEISEH